MATKGGPEAEDGETAVVQMSLHDEVPIQRKEACCFWGEGKKRALTSARWAVACGRGAERAV